MRQIDNLLFKIFEEYEDGTIGVDRCIELYAENNNLSEHWIEFLQNYCFIQGALDAGIPLDIIFGQRELSEVFSKEYIDWKCNGK